MRIKQLLKKFLLKLLSETALFGQTSRELLEEKLPDSNTQIQRHIRLTELITPILDMVDSGKIAIRPAVELSYLP